ncbi:DUF1588 domain-containing protein, partial [bacterium]|nr:DUF1588 domain-containing protein [bacterium]
YQLSDAEREAVVTSVYAKLDQKDIPERLLTPFEIANTAARVFGFDRDIYDPFESLYFLENLDSAYPTIDSPALMSATYLKEIESGLDHALNQTVAGGFESIAPNSGKAEKIKQHELRFRNNRTDPDRHPAVYLAFQTPPNLPIDTNLIKETADDKKRDEYKAKNAKAAKDRLEKIWANENTDLLDMRIRTPARLSCQEYGINLPIGKYRLKFKASALNRDLVKQVAESAKAKGGEPAVAKVLGTYRELLNAKAGLAIRHGGINRSRRGGVAALSKAGKLLHYFEIEDNTKQEYVCEIELTVPGQIEFEFVNGPWNERLNRLKLATVSAKEKRGGDFQLPCIRIHSKILLKRIAEPSLSSGYQLTSDDTAAELEQKTRRLISELSLDAHADELLSAHKQLDKTLSPEERYVQTLKWIAMSQAQLYIRHSKDDPDTAARFLSYSLFKKHPDAHFKTASRKFHEDELSANDLTKQIVTEPGFEDFLTIFVKYWLENRTQLDESKFSIVDLNLPFQQETASYLGHLFRKNLPVAELFASDYRMLSAPMASFYDITTKGLDRHEPQLVETPRNGGLLHQANFFIAHSDGVDPRPFSRAKWIVENAFGNRLSEPPGNINADQFIADAKVRTFEERTKIHAQSKACVSCHKSLDPVAFAIHDFDTLGRLTGKPYLEAKETLSTRLQSEDRTMARSFARHLVSYLIGRDTNIYDMKTVDEILVKTSSTGFRTRDILSGVLQQYFRE